MLARRLLGAGGQGGVENSASVVDHLNHTSSNVSTKTFSGATLGDADASRLIVLNIVSHRSSQSAAVTITATVGGVSCTQRLNFYSGAKHHHILTAEVPSGSTGDIELSYSNGNWKMALDVVRAVGTPNPVPHDTDTDSTSSSSLSLNVPADGFMVCTHAGNLNNASSWSGATESFDITNMTGDGSGSFDAGMTLETARSISITNSSSSESAAGATFGWA